jgi:protease-4
MKDYLRSLLDIDEDAKIPSATVANMKSVTTKTVKKTDNTIAILYEHGI